MGRKRKNQSSEYYSELTKKKYMYPTSENSTQAFLNARDCVCSFVGEFSHSQLTVASIFIPQVEAAFWRT